MTLLIPNSTTTEQTARSCTSKQKGLNRHTCAVCNDQPFKHKNAREAAASCWTYRPMLHAAAPSAVAMFVSSSLKNNFDCSLFCAKCENPKIPRPQRGPNGGSPCSRAHTSAQTTSLTCPVFGLIHSFQRLTYVLWH